MVLGDTLLRLDRAGEAEQAYRAALAADPGLQAARDGIARARARDGAAGATDIRR